MREVLLDLSIAFGIARFGEYANSQIDYFHMVRPSQSWGEEALFGIRALLFVSDLIDVYAEVRITYLYRARESGYIFPANPPE